MTLSILETFVLAFALAVLACFLLFMSAYYCFTERETTGEQLFVPLDYDGYVDDGVEELYAFLDELDCH